MTDHGAAAAQGNGGLAELAREAGAGVSAAFVLVAMMLPLGLIAFAPLSEYAVEPDELAAIRRRRVRACPAPPAGRCRGRGGRR